MFMKTLQKIFDLKKYYFFKNYELDRPLLKGKYRK